MCFDLTKAPIATAARAAATAAKFDGLKPLCPVILRLCVLNTNRTEIGVNYLFFVDGDTVWVSWLIGQAHDRALIATITAGREPRQAIVSQYYVWVELKQHLFSSGRHAFLCLFILTGRHVPLLISVVILNYPLCFSSTSKRTD